jgi:hypothetical protein
VFFLFLSLLQELKGLLAGQAGSLAALAAARASLSACNAYSASLFRAVAADFRGHVKTLAEARRALDSVCKRIRALKTLLARLK